MIKKYYSEHIIDEGKQRVSQNLLNHFKADLSKLKNSEYDLIRSDEDPSATQLFYPIVEQGELIASISFEKDDITSFGKEFIDTVKELSGGMAISIVNRKLEEEFEKAE